MSRCRDCALYALDRVKSASGAILSRKVAPCLWKSTETWPVSVVPSLNVRPSPGFMGPNDGARCGRFIKREVADHG